MKLTGLTGFKIFKSINCLSYISKKKSPKQENENIIVIGRKSNLLLENTGVSVST